MGKSEYRHIDGRRGSKRASEGAIDQLGRFARIVLASALALCLSPAAAFASAPEDEMQEAPTAQEKPAAATNLNLTVQADNATGTVHDLTAGAPATASCGNGEHWFGRFTAGEAGVYRFWSTGDTSLCAELYADDQMTQMLQQFTPFGDDVNFEIMYNLAAGQTVYLDVAGQ